MIKTRLTIVVSFFFIWLIMPIAEGMVFEAASTTLYDGIDVSEWQGDIDFEKVSSSGIEVVYIRSSEGSTYVDSYFEEHYINAKQAGLQIGFYHYVTARTVAQAQEQAHFFVSTISGKEFDGKLAMDFEDLSGLTNKEINEIAVAFIEEVEKLSGKEVVIYSDAYNASFVLDDALTSYSLWVADYGVSQPSDEIIWPTWSGWQYSDTGEISGVNGDVDLDYFTDDIFVKDSSPIEKPAKELESEKTTIMYRVKTGDTLTKIAAMYRTTVALIVAENDISNPNLIYPNEVLRIPLFSDSSVSEVTIEYVVKRGDTLSEIAQLYNTTVKSIVAENDISNPNLIYPNEVLRITQPQSSSFVYIVKAGNTLSQLALRFNTTVGKLVKMNSIRNPDLIFVNERLLIP